MKRTEGRKGGGFKKEETSVVECVYVCVCACVFKQRNGKRWKLCMNQVLVRKNLIISIPETAK